MVLGVCILICIFCMLFLMINKSESRDNFIKDIINNKEMSEDKKAILLLSIIEKNQNRIISRLSFLSILIILLIIIINTLLSPTYQIDKANVEGIKRFSTTIEDIFR